MTFWEESHGLEFSDYLRYILESNKYVYYFESTESNCNALGHYILPTTVLNKEERKEKKIERKFCLFPRVEFTKITSMKTSLNTAVMAIYFWGKLFKENFSVCMA